MFLELISSNDSSKVVVAELFLSFSNHEAWSRRFWALTPTALQVPEEQPVNKHNDEFNDVLCTELPGSLPEFTPVNISQIIVWSQSSENVITVNSSEIDKAYDEITA